jgi:endonuclease-3
MSQALERIGWVLKQMRKEAQARDAPVYRAERSTRDSPFKILVFTMLSSRTKDSTTMDVVERLFAQADTPEKVLRLGPGKLEKLLFGVGFFKTKAKNLMGLCRCLKRAGKVPDTLEGMLELPGVGRKTANIVLARAFGKATLGVDVHVHRISNRLGLVRTERPEDTERSLLRKVGKKHIRTLNRDFVAFGQTVCLPRNPRCGECPLRGICPRIGVKR